MNIIGVEVFCKRNGLRGTVITQDGQTLTIDCGDLKKNLTYSSFEKWWTIVPQDKEDGEDTVEEEVIPDDSPKDNGYGLLLRNRFIKEIQGTEIDGITFFYNEKTKTDIIKYHGFNVFECSFTKKKCNVICHPESLTPANKRRCTKMYPLEWGWALRAKFVFTDISQWPLMKSIIADGLFYRRFPKAG